MTSPTPITADMSVPDIVEQYPKTLDVFKQYGLHPNYKALKYENLSASVLVNQISLDDILKDLNKATL